METIRDPTEAERARKQEPSKAQHTDGDTSRSFAIRSFSTPDNSQRQAASAAAGNSLGKNQITVHFGQDTQSPLHHSVPARSRAASSPCLQNCIQEPVAPCAPHNPERHQPRRQLIQATHCKNLSNHFCSSWLKQNHRTS